MDELTPCGYLGGVLYVRAFLSFNGYLYICEGASWITILRGVTLICLLWEEARVSEKSDSYS